MKILVIGFVFIVGTFFGVLIMGLMQMCKRGDALCLNALKRFSKPDDYFNQFLPERRRFDRRTAAK